MWSSLWLFPTVCSRSSANSRPLTSRQRTRGDDGAHLPTSGCATFSFLAPPGWERFRIMDMRELRGQRTPRGECELTGVRYRSAPTFCHRSDHSFHQFTGNCPSVLCKTHVALVWWACWPGSTAFHEGVYAQSHPRMAGAFAAHPTTGRMEE